MLLVALFLGLVFYEPAWYRLKARGRKAGAYVWAALFLSAASVMAAQGLILADRAVVGAAAWLYASPWVVAAALRMVASLLPVRPGAPGDAALRPRASCRACGRTSAFPRRSAGKAVLCPACGEITTVPAAAGDPIPADLVDRDFLKGAPSSDPTVVRRYLFPQDADSARRRLAAAGIPAELAGALAFHAHPGIGWAGGGFRLMVPKDAWTTARTVLREVPEAAALDDEAAAAQAPAIPEQNEAGKVVMEALALAVGAPVLVGSLAALAAPRLFQSVQPGSPDPDFRPLLLAFTILALLRLIVYAAGRAPSTRPRREIHETD